MEPKKPKILIFSTAYYPFVAGAEVAIKEITDRISDIEFDLITARFNRSLPRKERIGNVEVYRVGFGLGIFDKLFLPPLGFFKTLSLKKKNDYKAFWCVMVTFASLTAYKTNKISRKKIPIILTLQEGDSEEHLTKRWFGLLGWAWKTVLRKTKFLTAISTYLLNRAKRLGYKGEAQIVPNGVDVANFSRTILESEIIQIKNQLGKKDSDVFLIHTGRFVTKNAISDIIAALPFLPAKIRLVLVGQGALEGELKEQTKKLKIEDRVIFRDFVSHDKLPIYLKASDIFIRPSLSEGFGNSFPEAMATGLPVIATPVGGIPDFLKDGETGLFCAVNNPKSIADAVMKLVKNPELVSKIKRQAFEMVKEKYDWDLIAKEMNNIFIAL